MDSKFKMLFKIRNKVSVVHLSELNAAFTQRNPAETVSLASDIHYKHFVVETFRFEQIKSSLHCKYAS